MATKKTGSKKKATSKASSKSAGRSKPSQSKKSSSGPKIPKPPTVPPSPKAPHSLKRCACGGDCHDEHAHLPGYLLIALGALAVPINFGMIPVLEWTKAWPLLLVLFGFVYIVKTSLCRKG